MVQEKIIRLVMEIHNGIFGCKICLELTQLFLATIFCFYSIIKMFTVKLAVILIAII